MNNWRLHLILLITGGMTFFSSCNESGGDEITKKTGVLIVNEGNFFSGNGSLSLYDEEQMTVENNVVQEANESGEIGATVQSLVAHDGVGYVICNGPDKIEFISLEDFSYLSNPLTDISQPRYMAVVENKGYVSCWGPWINWTLPDSYISVVDLKTKTVIDSLECGSGPEGIISVGNKLFIANSFEMTVSVVDLVDKSHQKIDMFASPQHFVLDGAGLLWVASSDGLQSINTVTYELGSPVAVANMSSKVAIDAGRKNIYLMTVEPWEDGKLNFGAEVNVFDTESKTLSSSALISGFDFYGIGINPTTDKLYIADSKAFSGNGVVTVYDLDGNTKDEQTVGIGPNGFVFK
jgi:DNA-binding beta-propeller fold protein YncE